MTEIIIQTSDIVQNYRMEIYTLLTLLTALISICMIVGGMDE